MNRNHLHLWILLAAAFAAMACVSVFGPVEVFGYELKDSGFSKILAINPKKTEAGHTTAKVVAPTKPAAKPKPVEVDTLPKKILFIGDSMLDGLYPRLAAYADKNGHTLYVVIWYSSTSETWGKSDRLKNYINTIHPDYVFICLGANELNVSDIVGKREKYVRKILQDIGSIPYLWIGPPNWKPDTGINGLIESNAAPGSFFLSNGMTFDRKKDGAHPTQESAELWMDSVARWMPQHSSHPIRMDRPTAGGARAKRVYVHQPNK